MEAPRSASNADKEKPLATPQIVEEVMTRSPRRLSASASVRAAAEEMKRGSVGAVVVETDGKVCGIVTDRDIVVRCIATGANCDQMSVGEICSPHLVTLSPRDAVDRAIELMRTKAIRRTPVVDNGRAVGIVSLGDLALVRDPNSALGGISAASPNL
jgi:CBS domain-containing protein